MSTYRISVGDPTLPAKIRFKELFKYVMGNILYDLEWSIKHRKPPVLFLLLEPGESHKVIVHFDKGTLGWFEDNFGKIEYAGIVKYKTCGEGMIPRVLPWVGLDEMLDNSSMREFANITSSLNYLKTVLPSIYDEASPSLRRLFGDKAPDTKDYPKLLERDLETLSHKTLHKL